MASTERLKALAYLYDSARIEATSWSRVLANRVVDHRRAFTPASGHDYAATKYRDAREREALAATLLYLEHTGRFPRDP